MTEYIENYIYEVDSAIRNDRCKPKMIKEHLDKIDFFQKERTIHLIVMIATLLFLLIFLALSYLDMWFFVIVIILFIISLFYVKHYYFLENTVQYMYKQYDELIKKCK